MKRVLVTGASGFIGRHLVPLLNQHDCKVSCLVRKTSNCANLDELGCEITYADALDADSVGQAVEATVPEVVYHLAGATKAIRRKQLFEVNQIGTRNLLRALAKLVNSPVTLIVSSLAAAGPALHAPRAESDQPAPVSNYGRSKLASESEARQFCDRIPITIVRPPIVFGPHDRDTFEMFRSIAAFGIHPVPNMNGMSVSWIQVEDVCRAFLAAVENGRRLDSHSLDAGIYFATSPEIVDYGELGRRIGEVLGRRGIWTPIVPSVGVWSLATINELIGRARGRPNIFNLDKAREGIAGSWTCSGDKLSRETGFRCRQTLSQTLESSAEWYRAVGWLP